MDLTGRSRGRRIRQGTVGLLILVVSSAAAVSVSATRSAGLGADVGAAAGPSRGSVGGAPPAGPMAGASPARGAAAVVAGTRSRPSESGAWREQILAADGSVDQDAYRRVAASYDVALDSRLGPTAVALGGATGAAPATVPTRGSGGWDGNCAAVRAQQRSDYWFAMSGQILHAPAGSGTDFGAGSPAGVARARNGSVYNVDGKACYDFRVSTTPDRGNHYSRSTDPAVTDREVAAANGGAPLSRPVAVARGRVGQSVDAVLVFANGMVVLTGTGNDRVKHAFARLPAGSVPTAVAMTNHSEFALVTVWNTRLVRGEVAVFALKGAPDGTDRPMEKYWGMPNYGLQAAGIKLLGTVSLPGMAAPTAVSATVDLSVGVPNRHDPSLKDDLSRQQVRDDWNRGASKVRQTAKAGFAVVASRAEGRVAFLDLQPLLQYYRSMYLTGQANFQRTTRQGPGPDQWPFAFTVIPQQRPVVTASVDLAAPTAVATGFPRGSAYFGWRGPDAFGSRAYVTTMDGLLRIYDVGGLATTDAPAAGPKLVRPVAVGRNPTSIQYGRSAYHLNDLVVTSRADKRVTTVDQDGGTVSVLRDQRWVDPVAAFPTRNNSGQYSVSLLTVLDFNGHQALNYVPGDAPRFGYATGFGTSRPFQASFAEVW